MLKALQKINNGQVNFTSKEMQFLAATYDYAEYCAKTGQTEALKRLLPGISEWHLFHIFQQSAEDISTESLNVIFLQSSEEPQKTKLRNVIHVDADEGYIPFWNAINSHSIEAVRLFIDYYEQEGGTDLVRHALEDNSLITADIPMSDEMLYLAHQYGGRELIKKTLEQDTGVLEQAVHDNIYDGKDTSDVIEYIIAKSYQYCNEGHLRTIVGEIQANNEIHLGLYWQKTEAIVTMLQSIKTIYGADVALNVVEQAIPFGTKGRYYLYKQAAMHRNDELLDVLRDILSETCSLTKKKEIEKLIEDNYGIGRHDQFARTVEDMITKIDSGTLSNQNSQDILKEACQAWIQEALEKYTWPKEGGHPEDEHAPYLKRLLNDSPIHIRETVIEEMIDMDDVDNFNHLLKLMHKIVGPAATFEMTRHVGRALNKSPQIFKQLCNDIIEHAGPFYMQTLLYSDNDNSQLITRYLDAAIENAQPEIVQTILDLAEKAGGQAFVEDIISIHNFAPIRVVKDNPEITYMLLERLSETTRHKAYKQLPEHWEQLYNKKISKSTFWQKHGEGQLRWQEITGASAPHPKLKEHSPFRFKPKLYAQILPLFQLLQGASYDHSDVVSSYKLSVMFSNIEEADQYLSRYITQWADKPHNTHSSLIKAACSYTLPINGIWTPQKWKPLLTKYGPAVFDAIKNAPKLEAYIGDDAFPKTLKELKAVIQETQFTRCAENPQFAKIAARHWANKDFTALANSYDISVEDLIEAKFNFGVDFLHSNVKTQDQLPDIFIDGETVGQPGFYMTRLAPNDPTGLILGDITDDCQTIHGNGHHCAIHGMTSQYGGFYVWKRKTDTEISENDPIVAQSWAWIGTDHSLVFDTFERKKSTYARLCQPFMEQFAHEVIGKHTVNGQIVKGAISSIRLGTDGYTPPLFIPHAEKPSTPIDYHDKSFLWQDEGRGGRESHVQYDIAPINHALKNEQTLPPPQSSEQAEQEALRYIAEATKRIQDQYHIQIKTGLELECYAIGTDGKASLSQLPTDTIQKTLQQYSKDIRFEQENDEHEGQFEAQTGTLQPVNAVLIGNKIRQYLSDNADLYGLQSFDFSPRPFEDKEASSLHISLSLWSENNKPLFSNEAKIPKLIKAIAKGILDIQQHTILMSAQTDQAYQRFGHSEWSPNGISFSNIGYEGASLRLANENGVAYRVRGADPKNIRLENRLPAADSNIAIAMAGMIAGVEHALEKYVHVLEAENENIKENKTDMTTGIEQAVKKYVHALKAMNEDLTENNAMSFSDLHNGKVLVTQGIAADLKSHPLPKTRYEAWKALQFAVENGVLSSLPTSLFQELLEQHNPEAPIYNLTTALTADETTISLQTAEPENLSL